MLKTIKRTAALATVGVCAAVTLAAGAPTASASTGNWTFEGGSGPVTLQHGVNAVAPGYGLTCQTVDGCTLKAGTQIVFQTANGATLLPPSVGTWQLGTPSAVANCNVTSPSTIQCIFTTDVSVPYNGLISTNSSAVMIVPTNLPPGTVVGRQTWFDPGGMWANNPAENNQTFYVGAI
ncbi:hypothetical protein [Kitasatospora sp. GAS204B]|uniref:hypothetical protein n=1 Tax=unclassified Kitasatospora TaxID=2633591 RepID=UPI002476EFC0|nr:hypothetical protein [Kitasatospora sp. GAS204B]MDH6119850.1 hypothetical protein [Kitasatospora sp. GAS204B]